MPSEHEIETEAELEDRLPRALVWVVLVGLGLVAFGVLAPLGNLPSS